VAAQNACYEEKMASATLNSVRPAPCSNHRHNPEYGGVLDSLASQPTCQRIWLDNFSGNDPQPFHCGQQTANCIGAQFADFLVPAATQSILKAQFGPRQACRCEDGRQPPAKIGVEPCGLKGCVDPLDQILKERNLWVAESLRKPWLLEGNDTARAKMREQGT
jgi:hypothetical protein